MDSGARRPDGVPSAAAALGAPGLPRPEGATDSTDTGHQGRRNHFDAAQNCAHCASFVRNIERDAADLPDFSRYHVCLTGDVLRFSCRAFVIVAAALICVAKLRGSGSVTPVVATQELNRCLSVVRAAARRSAASDRSLARQEGNVRTVA